MVEKQGMLVSLGEIAAMMGFKKSTVAATLKAHANCGPPPKKAPTGACSSTKGEKAFPLMMAIMERDPWMPLVQVHLQLGLHSIFTNKCNTLKWWTPLGLCMVAN
ncbi:hypothetical protein DSO57_1007621 [Entomophthora muscae]|uniref:Uncharacterized protein n=1 Tax=Entomophthora muscae TaxID=34485 RepID=A0ACC2TU79_9FUNG|nr:hypothetical protein DSO57_1007621 [Entomophthora muscae]